MTALGLASFNSRAREGRDLPVMYSGEGRSSFNSRAREGRDPTSSTSSNAP